MKIVFMKEDAIAYFKENLEKYYANYFTKPDNAWIIEEYQKKSGTSPFENFIEVDDFELADPDEYKPGDLETENCKRLYLALQKLSPSQAADERLWAGMSNGPFYDYLKRRFGNYELKNPKRDMGEIKSRFFFTEKGRAGVYSNPMSKWWWIGKLTYDPTKENHFEKLDIVGGADFSTKTMSLFYSYSLSASSEILDGIIEALRYLRDNNIRITWKKEYRAALRYLNAYGGSVLIDSLSSEEIKTIFLQKIFELLNGEEAESDFENEERDGEDENQEDEEETQEVVEENDKTLLENLAKSISQNEGYGAYVDYGDRVVVERVKDKALFEYTVPMSREAVEQATPEIIRALPGKTMSIHFFFGGKEYAVKNIVKNR